MKSPTRPNAARSAEHAEQHDDEGDLRAATDQQRAHEMIGPADHDDAPDSKATPATVCPVMMSQAPTPPHSTGTANGMMPNIVVSAARKIGAPTPATQ